MQHNSLKTYMRKGGFRKASRPSLRIRTNALKAAAEQAATLHYNCPPRGVNLAASWVVPQHMADGGCGGGAVLGWEVAEGRAPQDKSPVNRYAISCSVRCPGAEQWVFFKLDQRASGSRMRLVPAYAAGVRRQGRGGE